MVAPLHSKYRRNFDRDVKLVQMLTSASLRKHLFLFKNKARVYELTANASREAGVFSTQGVPDMLEALRALYLPTDRVWVEVDWNAMQEGVEDGGLLGHPPSPDRPCRLAFLYARDGETNIEVYVYYLYPSGKTMFGPAALSLASEPSDVLTKGYAKAMKQDRHLTKFVMNAAGGYAWHSRNDDDHPRLANRLRAQWSLVPAGYEKLDEKACVDILKEMNGTGRVAVAALSACIAARAPGFIPSTDGEERERRQRDGERHTAASVDLFIRPTTRKGKTILRALRAAEAQRRRQYEVGAHWNYRHRDDGGDPMVCPVHERGHHDFERIEGTQSEECALCGQRRWFKRAHKRGDPSVGVVPPKRYRVRAG